MKKGLHVIVNLFNCKSIDGRFRAGASRFKQAKDCLGLVVDVIGPPIDPCDCCVSVLPALGFEGCDPRGYVCRKDNLLPLEGPDAGDFENEGIDEPADIPVAMPHV